MKTLSNLRVVIAVVACSVGMLTGRAAAESIADESQKLYYGGSYAEAEESYRLLAEKDAVTAALGMARCQRAVGSRDKAVATLEAAAKDNAKNSRLPAMLAELAVERGDYENAQKWADGALEIEPNETSARWVVAELHRLAGRIEEAEKAYEWFIDFYNQTDNFEAEDLHFVGRAATQFARWNRLHDQFSFMVNELYPDVLTLQKDYWPAHLESGLLFLEKYNQADAEIEFQAALKINPNAAEVHAAVARLALQNYELEKATKSIDRALEINSNLLTARQLKADVEFANFEAAKAEKILSEALPLCPVSETTLGRLAVARGCVDGLTTEEGDSRMAGIIKDVRERNKHAGVFFETMADSLDTMRRYPEAAHFFEEATRVMPELVGAYGKLGLVHMRLGDEDQARKILEKSFDVDFGNVRIKNSLEVLDVLDTYETLETDHFKIRYDPKHDTILARYIGDYLEQVYPSLCEQLGYEPKDKSLFEIFNKAKNTRGHGWFSARMVGLPHIHTIGACAGKMVAMVSPGDMDKQFNWARVVKHEFVHVINLQQTNFRIPHWYTEALAVYNEGYPRPQSWNNMLVRRVPAGETFNLDTINLGFIRPSNSEDWQMAYCQAELYAEFMVKTFGEDALAKMLEAYADNLDTPKAIQRAFSVSVKEFEEDYAAHVKKLVEGLSGGDEPTEKSIEDLQAALKEDPDNPDLLASVGRAYLARKEYPKAGETAGRALELQPKHQEATYVRARLKILVGERDGVLKLLEEALDRNAPQTNLLQLLAGLKYKAEDYAAAVELYELGRRKFPGDPKWLKLLARVHLKAENNEHLRPLLEEMALADGDDLTTRKKLAQMAQTKKDWPSVVRWATDAIHIDVLDVDMHRLLAEALVEQKEYDDAIDEFEVAIELKPKQLQLRFALADACVQAGHKDKARKALEELIRLDPDYPGADVLRESLEQ